MKEMLNEWKRFLNEETYYHGGGKDFLPTRIGTFYSKDRSYAEKYAKHHKEGEVFEVGIDLSQANVYPKTFWWQEFQEIWKPEEMFKGYDAVKVIEPNGEDPSIVVLNPDLVKRSETTSSEDLEYLLSPPGETAQIGDENGRVPRPGENGILRYRTDHGSYRYVKVVDGQIIAGLQVMSRDILRGKEPATAKIANVYTHPDFRRQGHAADLLAKAKTFFDKVLHSKDLTSIGSRWKSGVGS